MGLPGSENGMLTQALIDRIEEENERLGIPQTMRDFGIDEAEFQQKVEQIAVLAVGDACTGSNPREIAPREMERLLTCIYYGNRVDF